MPASKVVTTTPEQTQTTPEERLRNLNSELMALSNAGECLRSLGTDADFAEWRQPIEDALGPVEMVESLVLDLIIKRMGRDQLKRIVLDHYSNW